MLVWQVEETAGFDAAWVTKNGVSLQATGRAVGQLPEPYWLTYRLETDEQGATSRVIIDAETRDGRRRLDLQRRPDVLGSNASWTVDGDERPDLADAWDCDIACCPLTNTMPILRHELHTKSGEYDFVMAFIEVPSLRVVASRQTYTHLGIDGDLASIRYRSGSFSSDLVIDADGFVVDYPSLGHRMPAAGSGENIGRSSGPGSPRADSL
jgi:uncharacterized protein